MLLKPPHFLSPRPPHFLFSLLCQVLLKHKIVTEEVAGSVKAFISANQTRDPTAAPASVAEPVKAKRWGGAEAGGGPSLGQGGRSCCTASYDCL